MTVSINFSAEQCAAWAAVSTTNGTEEKRVALYYSGRPPAYMTPEMARHLAAELLQRADEADPPKDGR